MKTTVSDCHLDGTPILIDQLCLLDSTTIEKIVGQQQPGEHLECSSHYYWSFQCLALEKLRCSNDFGEEPDGDWKQAYLRHAQSDENAVKMAHLNMRGDKSGTSTGAKTPEFTHFMSFLKRDSIACGMDTTA